MIIERCILNENGAFEVNENGTILVEMLQEITREEFEKRFPDVSTYDANYDPLAIFLENGTILLDSEYNGEKYNLNNSTFYPVYRFLENDEIEIVGYVER